MYKFLDFCTQYVDRIPSEIKALSSGVLDLLNEHNMKVAEDVQESLEAFASIEENAAPGKRTRKKNRASTKRALFKDDDEVEGGDDDDDEITPRKRERAVDDDLIPQVPVAAHINPRKHAAVVIRENDDIDDDDEDFLAPSKLTKMGVTKEMAIQAYIAFREPNWIAQHKAHTKQKFRAAYLGKKMPPLDVEDNNGDVAAQFDVVMGKDIGMTSKDIHALWSRDNHNTLTIDELQVFFSDPRSYLAQD